MKRGHVPVRQCVGCRARVEKVKLARFVTTDAGWLQDVSGREPGRGAYLCSPECAERVKKNKRYRGLASAAKM